MLGICFVIMMVALDQTVIGTALPTVVSELRGFELYAWVGTSYLLASVIAVPIFGKLGDEHGRKPWLLAAIVVFTLASMLCGLAQSMLQLVLARGIQGIGGGMLMGTAFACIPDLFPDPRERLRWQVLFSTSFGLANAIGPSLGGYLAQYWGWRWVFFVNLPVGLASLVFVWRFLPLIRHQETTPSRLDWLGALLMALALGSLQLWVEWLPQHKPLWVQASLACFGVLAGGLFIWWERRSENPVVPLAMFSHPSLGPLLALSVLMGFCMFAVMYFAPLMFQGGFALSPNAAGVLVTPLAVFITVGSIINGRIVTRLPSPNVMLYVGVALFGLASLALTQITATTAHVWIVLTMMLAGGGLGVVLPNLTVFAQASGPRTQLGVATAMLQSMRMVGGMLGTALIGTFVSHRYERGVETLLASHDGRQWTSWLADPQILVDADLASRFVALLAQAGQESAVLLSGARLSLIDSIHHSQWLVVGLMVVAVFMVRRIPPMNLRPHPATRHPDHG